MRRTRAKKNTAGHGGRKAPAPARDATVASREALPLRQRQRQRLIDASITALHLYGPTGTTVARVVAIAKLSPGIVRFYFRSKAAMLVESLQFLATEFEERVVTPVAAMRDQPALALQRLVELYLDPEIASPRKIAVWYAFWGEANARQEYLAICGQKDANFAALVHDLIERMIVASGRRHLDGEAVALGLVGVLELLWQEFAFADEAEIDRPRARQRCMAYLRSVFPREFPAIERGPPGSSSRSVQHSADDERDRVFRGTWQFAGHELDLPHPGDFATLDLIAARALVVRDAQGTVRAFRNACRGVPHALVSGRRGRFVEHRIACSAHGLAYGLDGRSIPPRDGAGLLELELRGSHGFLFVRSPAAARRGPEPDVAAFEGTADLRPASADAERSVLVAADWKIVMRTLLDSERRRFVGPNLVVERSTDTLSIVQVQPIAAGRSTVRSFEYVSQVVGSPAEHRSEQARASSRSTLERELALAESTQQGQDDPDYRPDTGRALAPAVTAFEQMLLDAEC